MRLKFYAVICITILAGTSLNAQDEEFKPSGSPFAKVYFDFHTDFIDTVSESQFQAKRVYFGYKYNLSEYFSAKVTFDVGKADVNVNINDSTTVKTKTSLHYTAYVKHAQLTYKKDNLTLDIGLIGNRQYKINEKYWNRRYLAKTFQDEYKIGPSADFGISANYKIHDFISVDATIRNGEGYKKLQGDDAFVYAGGFHLTPLKGLVVRGYYDYSRSEDVTQSTIAHFAGYKNDIFSIGAEYSMQSNHYYEDGNDIGGLSAFAGYHINEKLELFGRYESYAEEADANEDHLGIIGGIEYSPISKIQVALNFRSIIYAEEENSDVNSIYVNFQYAF